MTNKLLWDLIEPATSLFEVTVAYLYFRDFLGKRRDIRGWIYPASFLFYCAALCLLNLFCGYPIVNALFSLVSLVVLSLLFEGSLAGHLFSAALFIAFDMVSDMLSLLCIMALTQHSQQQIVSQSAYRLLGILISNLLLLGITRIVCIGKIEHGTHSHLHAWQWAFLLTLPFVSIVILYTLFSFDIVTQPELTMLRLVSAVGMLFFNLILYFLFTSMMHFLDAQAQVRLLKQQVEFQAAHYRELEASQKEIRRIRHDMNNHLLCLKHLLNSRQYMEAESYLSSLGGAVEDTSDQIDTGNAVLDSLLSAKLMTIQANRIHCEKTIAIPSGLSIAPIDLCIILGNSFDNAIEACTRMKEGKPEIQFVLIYRNKSLMLHLTNTTDAVPRNTGGRFLSAKRRFCEPGIGLSNMERVVQKYDGVMETACENGLFSLSILLNHIEPEKMTG